MNLVSMCKVLKDAFEGEEDREDHDPITLGKVDKKNLERVIAYCTYHKFAKKETDL